MTTATTAGEQGQRGAAPEEQHLRCVAQHVEDGHQSEGLIERHEPAGQRHHQHAAAEAAERAQHLGHEEQRIEEHLLHGAKESAGG
jgi:hypothetical protein